MSSATKIETDKQAITGTVETSPEVNSDTLKNPPLPKTNNEVVQQNEHSIAVYEQEYEYAQLHTVKLEEQTIIQGEIVEHDKVDTSNTNTSIGEVRTPALAQETYDSEDTEVLIEAHSSTREDIVTNQVPTAETVVVSRSDNEILAERSGEAISEENESYTAAAADTKTVAEFSAGIAPHENIPVTSLAELQDLLDTLPDTLPGIEKNESHPSVGEKDSKTIPVKETQAEIGFIGQFVQYVQSLPENPKLPQAEQPIAILAEIVRTAQEIHTVQDENLETVNLEAEHTVLQEKAKELQQLCTKLFKELGIEADEEVVTQIANALVAHAAANEKAEQIPEAMSIEELAKQGTHEYKLTSWFNQFFSYSKPLSHLVGTAALRLSKLSTSI